LAQSRRPDRVGECPLSRGKADIAQTSENVRL
jgi:hypothetical protein